MHFKFIAGLVSGLVSASAFCSPIGESLMDTTRSVYQAFSRYSAPIDGSTLQKKAPPSQDVLFPQYGFTPRKVGGLSWSLTPSSDDSSNFCIWMEVNSVSAWNDALVGLSQSGLHAADPQTCAMKPRFGYAPATFPAVIAGMATWDRRDIPSATVVPGYPMVMGVDSAAVTRPGLTVASSTGATFAIYNPYVPVPTNPPVDPPPGMLVGVTGVSVRPEFVVSQQCGVIASESSCSVQVQYQGTSPVLAGQLFLYFSNGAVANIGLLGKLQ